MLSSINILSIWKQYPPQICQFSGGAESPPEGVSPWGGWVDLFGRLPCIEGDITPRHNKWERKREFQQSASPPVFEYRNTP